MRLPIFFLTVIFTVLSYTSAFCLFQVDTTTVPPCDTILLLNGETIIVSIYRHDAEKVLYKYCDEEGSPRRGLETSKLAGLYDQKTESWTIYRKSIAAYDAIEKVQKTIDQKEEQYEAALYTNPQQYSINLGMLSGGVFAPFIFIVASYIFGRQISYLSLGSGFLAAILAALTSKVPRYKHIAVGAAILAFVLFLALAYVIFVG